MRKIGPVGAIPSKWCGTVTLRLRRSWFPRIHLEGAAGARQVLVDAGFDVPGKGDLAGGLLHDDDPSTPKHGWQYLATQSVNHHFIAGTVWPRLPDRFPGHVALSERTIRQCSLHVLPSREAHYVRRTSLSHPSPSPLVAPLSSSSPLDSSGHHRAACVVAGVLGSRGFAVESAAARVWREAGGRVTTNMRIQDMDIVVPNQLDERRIEVLADGLPLFHGTQVAVDTTLVSAFRRNGAPRPRCADVDGAVLEVARRRKSSGILSSLADRAEHHCLSCEQKWEKVVSGDYTVSRSAMSPR